MNYDRWASVEELWHAYDADGKFVCGLKLVDFDEGRLIQATEDDVYPPTPCPSCLYETAMRDCIPEPLDVAKARGYIKGDLS